jgi:hypothetical protein
LRLLTDTAMLNEVLCKVLAHNLCLLIQEQQVLGIVPIFWKEPAAAARAIAVCVGNWTSATPGIAPKLPGVFVARQAIQSECHEMRSTQ